MCVDGALGAARERQLILSLSDMIEVLVLVPHIWRTETNFCCSELLDCRLVPTVGAFIEARADTENTYQGFAPALVMRCPGNTLAWVDSYCSARREFIRRVVSKWFSD